MDEKSVDPHCGQAQRRHGPLSKSDASELLEAFKQVTAGFDQLEAIHRPMKKGNTGIATITVNAGGAATWITAWIASMSCALMLGGGVVSALWMASELRRYDEQLQELRRHDAQQSDYLSAIYMQAPHLRPAEKED